jgi:hypothetical protein
MPLEIIVSHGFDANLIYCSMTQCRHLGVQFKEYQSWNHQEVLTGRLKAEPKQLMKRGARNQHLLAFSRNVQLHPGPRL